MTIQERPSGEQTELQDTLSTNGVAVADQEPFVEQSQPVADEPTPAEQTEDAPAAVAEQAAPIAAAQTEPHADAPGAAETSATPETDTTGAQDAVSGQTASESDAPLVTSAEVEGPVTSEPPAEATASEAEPTAPVASEPPVTNATPAESTVEDEGVSYTPSTEATAEDEGASYTPSAEATAEDKGASYTPSTEATTEDEGASHTPHAEATAEDEGASYTPPAEDSSRPRRVKDLQPGMELDGRVTSIALYGIFVDLGVGRDGLVHISEMSDQRIDSPSDVVQIGDSVKVRVKSVEPDGRRISLTMRSPERTERRERGERGGRKKPELNRERLASLRVGDTVDGTVTGIAPFGVFVDIGVGKDGLVHISELAEGRIEKAEDAVQVGQTYPFKLLEVDADGTRISLSLRRAQRTQRMQQLDKGQIVEGVVSGIAPFGAFVDIGVGRDGLVHISELAENRVNRVEDVVKVGDKVQVRVLEADSGSKRISLSMILEERPQEEAAQRRDPSSSPPREGSPSRDLGAPREGSAPRQERARRDYSMPSREERPRRDDRRSRQSSDELIQYSTPAEPEFEGDNATLEDLLSKYGSGGRRDNKRRRQEEEEEPQTEDRGSTRRQRDAIRRTLQQMDDE